MKSEIRNILIILAFSTTIGSGQDIVTYSWPDQPFDASKIINGTFCEFRNTGSADHFHNAVDIGEPDGNPVFACLDGTVYSIVHDASNSYVSVLSVVEGGWKRFTYLHIVPNPALSVGQNILARQSILGTIYSGMGHVHLIEREIVSNPDNSAVEINNIRPEGGLAPYNDPEAPIIYTNTIRFYSDNSYEEQSPNALFGKVDIKVKVVDRNGSTSSGSNNGTYILGYRLWNKDTSEVIYALNKDGLVYKFDRKPLDSYVHNVFVANEATLSNPVYWLTNGTGAVQITSSRNVDNNYLNTDLFGEGEYVLEIFAEDTRANKVNTYLPVQFTTPPATPVLKAVLNVDRRKSVKVIWEKNTESDLAGYRLYFSVNTQLSTWALAADESMLTAEKDSYLFNSPSEFINVPSSDIYFFYITAVDSGGAESKPSDIYSRAPHINGTTYPEVLIVDGFDQYDGIGSYAYPTHEFNTSYFIPLFVSDSLVISSAADEAVTDAEVYLGDYNIVIWFTGDDGGPVKSLTNEEQLLIQDYLEHGGKLLISGSELGLDLGHRTPYSTENDSIFYRNYLKAEFVQSGTSQMNSISGIEGKMFENTSLTIGQVYPENRPDDIDPIDGSEVLLKYNSLRNSGEPRIAGVGFRGMFPKGTETGAVIYLPFTFETAADLVQRKNFMSKVLEYFNLTTNIAADETTTPKFFEVHQNFPNPFNPSTVIKIEIPFRARVKINLFNTLGERIKTIAESDYEAGTHQLTWNASNMPSGVYFAQVAILNNQDRYKSDYSKIIKMLLLK